MFQKFAKFFVLFSLACILGSSIGVLNVSGQAHAVGVPQLYADDPYDNPYYDHWFIFDGNNFTPNSTVTFTWNYAPVGTTPAGTVQTDATGSFQFKVDPMPSIPYHSPATLIATDVNGLQASTSVIEEPYITSQPEAGSIGSTVQVSGGGYGSNETVNVYFGAVVASATTDSIGRFSASFIVPQVSYLGGSGDAIEVKGVSSGADSYTSFVVIPKITMTPNQGPAGTEIHIKGEYFTSKGYAFIEWIAPDGTQTTIGETAVSDSGKFGISVYAPATTQAGVQYTIEAYDAPSGQWVTTTFVGA